MAVRDSILEQLEHADTLTTDELLDRIEDPNDIDRLKVKKRLLYHLKALEKRGEITVVARREHGLKVYRKAYAAYEPHIERTIFEESGLFVRANEHDWGRSVDSILIDADGLRERTIERMLLAGRVTDAICVLDPDPMDERLLGTLTRRARDLRVTVSLSASKLNAWDDHLTSLITTGAYVVIRLTAAQFSDLAYRASLLRSIELALDHGTEWYVQNLDTHEPPVFIGTLGPHTFEAREFANRTGRLHVCTQNTYCVDVNRFLRHHQLSELREALLASMDAIGRTNIAVRSRIDDILPDELIEPTTLSLARTYVRFWNYGLKEPNIDQDTVLLLLESTKEVLEHFTIGQETIYTSCGMPMRFRLGFAPLFSSAIPRSFSAKRFPRLEVNSSTTLRSDAVEEMLRDREHTSAIFSGGDRVRIHRHPDVEIESVLREMLWLHKTNSLPLVCYAFRRDAPKTLLDY